MASARFTLCNPLCFLSSKYGSLPLKVLKSALIDFYNSNDISNAKQQLLDDIRNANLSDYPPHIPERRSGELRTVNEVDDIFVLMSFMDEKKLLKSLPLYVSDSPDKMPSLRLYEGDLKILMELLDKMSSKLNDHDSALATIASDLHKLRAGLLQARPMSSVNTAEAAGPSTNRGATNTAEDTMGPSDRFLTRLNRLAWSNTNQPEITAACNAQIAIKPDFIGPSASTPAVSRTRASSHVTVSATDDDQSDYPYVEQHTRKYKRLKRKISNSFATEESNKPQPEHKSVQFPKQHSKRLTVYGRSSGGDFSISAAKKLVKKAVFCIDNIDTSCNAEDITQYVQSQGIAVISCFEVQPRHRRHETTWNDRKAFRLCIRDDQCDKLLEASRWPDSVTISEWFFKSQQPQQPSHGANLSTQVDKRQHAETSDQCILHSDITNENNTGAPTKSDVLSVEDDMELTILTQDTHIVGQTAGTSNNIS